jgi:nucleotide-binding universal stress UspA family protein
MRLERVLAATDGSLHAEAALRFLGALALPETTEVRVCAVSEQPAGSPLAVFSRRGERDASLLLLLETERRTAMGAAAKARGVLGSLRCRLQTSLRTGDAARELADEVERWVPDLLVLGARGRTAEPDVPLGSVAEDLLRGAPCPTLLVRA